MNQEAKTWTEREIIRYGFIIGAWWFLCGFGCAYAIFGLGL